MHQQANNQLAKYTNPAVQFNIHECAMYWKEVAALMLQTRPSITYYIY